MKGLTEEKRKNAVLVLVVILFFSMVAASFTKGTLQGISCIASIILFGACVAQTLFNDDFRGSVPDMVLESKHFPSKKYAILVEDTTIVRIRILSEKNDTNYNIKVVDLEQAKTIITEISKASDIIRTLDEHGITEIQTATVYLLSKKQKILKEWTETVYPQLPHAVDATVDALIKKQKAFLTKKAICMAAIVICEGFIFCMLLLFGRGL